jgi:nicotinamidase-related amidase
MSGNEEGVQVKMVFWDVDTQFDFMTPAEQGGKLYVKDLQNPEDAGAIVIKANLKRLTDHAREHGILRVATGDWHTLEHREIDADAPDFRLTYPPHCMAGEIGSEKIPETALRDPIVIPLGASPETARAAASEAKSAGCDIFLRKEEFSCFTGNLATEALIDELDPDRFVVYGVALDVCVKYAIEGMLERGRKVVLVEDATWGLGLDDPAALIGRWEVLGLERTTTDEVVSGALSS